MSRRPATFLFTTPLLGAALFVGCGTGFESCEESRTCAPADGDGDLGGNPGDGDGDGDGTGGGGGGAPSACDPECDGDTPHCDDSDDPAVCVECLNEGDCSGSEQCNEDGECVACLEHEHCEDADASRCDMQTCAPCEDNDDCSHIADRGVCEEGLCVECTPAADDRDSDTDACGTGVCNPETLECEDGLTQKDKDVCEECIADAECATDYNCMPMQFSGGGTPVELGGYCMKVFSTGCARPFGAGDITRLSLSGVITTFCGILEDRTTCESVLELTEDVACTDPSDCGSSAGEGLCENVNGLGDQCTYACTGNSQCATGYDCNTYCGG